MSAGRPSIYTDKLAQRICDRLSGGETINRISQDDDMPTFVTIYDWSNKKPEFSKLLTRAKELAGHKHSELSHDIISGEAPHIDNMGRYDTGWVKLMQLRSASHARLAGRYNASYNDKLAQRNETDTIVEVEI